MMTTKAIKDLWDSGLKTLPVSKDKTPFGGHKWKEGVSDIDAYKKAFGVAIVAGQVSGGVECLDFDNHFGDAKQRLSEFMVENKQVIQQTGIVIASTVGGGYHVIYRCEEIGGNTKVACKPMTKPDGRVVPDAVIETRGEGGYFVSVPTPGYNVLRGDIHKIPTISREQRQQLFDCAYSYNEWNNEPQEVAVETGRPGDLFNQDPDSAQMSKDCLRKHGWRESKKGHWRRPDKKEGSSATFGKVGENIFYVFSSNAYPFEPQKCYTPFQVISILDYNGDFGAFARDLTERYKTEKPKKKEYAKSEPKVFEASDMQDILKRAWIDVTIPVQKPPCVIVINDFEYGHRVEKRLFSLGNFSSITGKSKSKKTFFVTTLLAAAIKNSAISNKIIGTLPSAKSTVILFDTEQSEYDAYMTAKRACTLADTHEGFFPYDLREYSPKERCQIIEYVLEKNKDNAGYVVIDGIADLATTIMDEEEATRVVSLLMKWTKIYNCHITTVIHQNKENTFATGHLGSAVMKKSECIVSVTKHDSDYQKSVVKCDMIRGESEFSDFELGINDSGLPYLINIGVVNDTECPF